MDCCAAARAWLACGLAELPADPAPPALTAALLPPLSARDAAFRQRWRLSVGAPAANSLVEWNDTLPAAGRADCGRWAMAAAAARAEAGLLLLLAVAPLLHREAFAASSLADGSHSRYLGAACGHAKAVREVVTVYLLLFTIVLGVGGEERHVFLGGGGLS